MIVEDDPVVATTLANYMQRAGHIVTSVGSAEEALALLNRQIFDAIIADLTLPGMDGLAFLREVVGDAAPPVIILTGNTEVDTVVSCMRAGAADYVAKPLTMKCLELVLARVVETSRLRREVDRLTREVVDSDPDPETTLSPLMKQALNLARRCASSPASSALLVGESGVGKEVLAAFIHRCSGRSKGSLVRINVAAIPDTMIEAELFGAVRGAFTDSKRDRQGFFSAADGGTLLLDEIGELKVDLQAKLLRAIETKRFFPVGAAREVSSDVHIIAATNRDPVEAVASGRLRADLYYRLAGVLISIPPLRERREDIPSLARAVLAKERRRSGRGPSRFDAASMARLVAYDWPGNVRELKNAIERACMLTDSEVVTLRDLDECAIFRSVGVGSAQTIRVARAFLEAPSVAEAAPPLSAAATPAPSSVSGAPLERGCESLESIVRVAAEEAERKHLVAVLDQTKGSRTRAAEILGISRSTLWHKLRRYGLEDAGS